MKKTLFLAVAAVTALFSACSCDELATNGAADGNMVNVTFSADLDQALVTRGVAGESDGTAATKLYVAVYNKDKQLIEAIQGCYRQLPTGEGPDLQLCVLGSES